jgi:hypothetical protein
MITNGLIATNRDVLSFAKPVAAWRTARSAPARIVTESRVKGGLPVRRNRAGYHARAPSSIPKDLWPGCSCE